jgi:hypothetical protein
VTRNRRVEWGAPWIGVSLPRGLAQAVSGSAGRVRIVQPRTPPERIG